MSMPDDPDVCHGKDLFISIHVRPNSTEERNAIRRTWAAKMPANVLLRFFVCRMDVKTRYRLMDENRQYGDIVFCGLPDDYAKLHLKVT
ncbi:hypothetical protein AAVH_21741, partial [Aphelenchoides avenae]